MAFVIKFAKGVRNHWKKSTFAACLLVYGGKRLKNKYEIDGIMKVYCEEALTYGKKAISGQAQPRKITVILNPAANKRSSLEDYEKYCSPILNLAGICVDVIHTESEGHAKNLVQDLKTTDALIVAGGDGTLSEVVTGLIRRTGENNSKMVPIGVLPLGKSNTVGGALFPGGEHLGNVRSMADAAMAIVREGTKLMDVMKIEIIGDNNTNTDESADIEITENVESAESKERKAVYALAGIEWGAYRDASANKDKYWYYGPLKKYATYVFNGYKDSLNWRCEALIQYSEPCEGCSNCVAKEEAISTKWYSRFIRSDMKKDDRSRIVNEKCTKYEQKHISTADFACITSNIFNDTMDTSPPKLYLNLGPQDVHYLDFLSEGFRSETGQKRQVVETIEARQIELRPNLEKVDAQKAWFSIDKDDFEVKPVKVTLLPKVITMFCNDRPPAGDSDSVISS